MIDPGNLPLWLRENGRFCTWRYETREGADKPTKVPYNPLTASRLDCTRSNTFTTLDIAEMMQAQYDGLGVGVFNGLCAIDIDHCIDENGQLSELAEDVLERMNAYVEKSPSGTGLHLLFLAPGFKFDRQRYYINRRDLGLEVYVSGATNRFVTLTGDTLTPDIGLEDRSEQLQALLERCMARSKAVETPTGTERKPVPLSDDEIIEKALAAKNGAAIRSLWEGDATGYPSHSEADIALCNSLAFWTNGDPERVDRLFRRSGLMREKWDQLRGAETYGATTVANAVRTMAAGYDPVEYSRREALKAFTESAAADPISNLEGSKLSLEIVRGALRDLGITVRYNLLLKEAEVRGLPERCSIAQAANLLPIYLQDYLKTCGIKGVTVQTVRDYLTYIEDEHRYNPVEEYLFAGHWDGVDRLPEIYRILGVDSVPHQSYIRKWLIQCVALALNDEENPIGAEGVLVLQGDQGVGKTAFFRILTPFPKWFIEGVSIDLKDKDSVIRALGGWIAELGELDSTLKREQMALKAFITSPEDRIRMPYAREATRSPRRTSFCGTVNPDDFLRDESGSRRYWIIPIYRVDKVALFRLPKTFVDQLWYQVNELYQADHNSFRLTDEEMKLLQQQNQSFAMPLRFELEIREALTPTLEVEKWEWWSAAEVKTWLLHGEGDTVAVGRTIAKLARELAQGVCPIVPTFKRKTNGVWKYLLPLRHFGGS